MGGAAGAPHLLPIYLISKMHTKTIQKIQKAYIKTYEEDEQIYKDIENSQGQGAFFFANTGGIRLLSQSAAVHCADGDDKVQRFSARTFCRNSGAC